MKRSRSWWWFLWLPLILLFCQPAQALEIKYPSFPADAIKDFQLNGEAASLNPNDDQVLRLTGKDPSRAGSAFLRQPVSLGPNGSFNTFFHFRMTPVTSPGGDGFTFTIQLDPRAACALGPGGGDLGYTDISPSVAVEFDTYYNYEWDPKCDQHVAILRLGSVAVHLAYVCAPVMNDDNEWTAWIDYDGTTMEVRFSNTGERPKDPQIQYEIDLLELLKGNQAYLGFTAGTGDLVEVHDIISWYFSTPTPRRVYLPFILPLLLED
jgi:hypothetical protein